MCPIINIVLIFSIIVQYVRATELIDAYAYLGICKFIEKNNNVSPAMAKTIGILLTIVFDIIVYHVLSGISIIIYYIYKTGAVFMILTHQNEIGNVNMLNNNSFVDGTTETSKTV